MKILFISMHSIHAIRWIQNLKDTEHELYWFDILDGGKLETIDFVEQFIEWKKRKLPNIKGEYFLYKKFPKLYLKLQPFLEVTAGEKVEQIIREINPDLVHSFEMQSCSYPILNTMQKFPNIKWLYSCWGSDLFYYQNDNWHKSKIIKVLNRINYIHTDCQRDFNIARKLGFQGKHLGVIPGGGGYSMLLYEKYKIPLKERKYIIVKGYQHRFGRALSIIYALEGIQEQLKELEVVVFGAHREVVDYVKNKKLPFIIYPKDTISHDAILEIMGKSIVYIGNSISDGMPNSLLEAMFMGAFPIQSNPGGATGEIIRNGENGFLIEKVENIEFIQKIILQVVKDIVMLEIAFLQNQKIAGSYLNYNSNHQKIRNTYKQIEEDIQE